MATATGASSPALRSAAAAARPVSERTLVFVDMNWLYAMAPRPLAMGRLPRLLEEGMMRLGVRCARGGFVRGRRVGGVAD
jgi:hypothetical protein